MINLIYVTKRSTWARVSIKDWMYCYCLMHWCSVNKIMSNWNHSINATNEFHHNCPSLISKLDYISGKDHPSFIVSSSIHIYTATKISNLRHRTAMSNRNIKQLGNGVLEQINYILNVNYVKAKIYVRTSFCHWLGAHTNIQYAHGYLYTRVL